MSPVRAHDQARVRRRHQLGGGLERRDAGGEGARCQGRFGRSGSGFGGGCYGGHVRVFWVVFSVLEVGHAVRGDRKTEDALNSGLKEGEAAVRLVCIPPPAGQEGNRTQK